MLAEQGSIVQDRRGFFEASRRYLAVVGDSEQQAHFATPPERDRHAHTGLECRGLDAVRRQVVEQAMERGRHGNLQKSWWQAIWFGHNQ